MMILSLFLKNTTNVCFLVSDAGFSGRISVLWRAGKIFSCQHLDLNLSSLFENRSTDNVFMAKMNFE